MSLERLVGMLGFHSGFPWAFVPHPFSDFFLPLHFNAIIALRGPLRLLNFQRISNVVLGIGSKKQSRKKKRPNYAVIYMMKISIVPVFI